jgi:hypothetical protein
MPRINSRRSGYEGEYDAKKYLISLGYKEVDRRSSGEKGSDLKATAPDGIRYSIEVKYTDSHSSKHWKQCKKNAETDGLPPMLMWRPKNVGTSDWLVLRNGKWEVLR